MIRKITVINHLNEKLELDLANPYKTGLAITSIEGLGPAKATINMTTLSTNDGSLFNSALLTNRNIVINFRLLPSNTVEETRLRSYKYFPIKKNVTLIFETDNRIAYIDGYVESNTPTIFSTDGAEVASVSIICPDPYFYDIQTNYTYFSGAQSLFEFPFSNESLVENTIEFSKVEPITAQDIEYDGDAEVGMVIQIHAIGTVKNLILYSTNTQERIRIDDEKLEALTGNAIIPKDTITINTIQGQKGIILLRDGKTINILNCLDRDTDWFKFYKGINSIAYVAEEGRENVEISISNRIAYEGI